MTDNIERAIQLMEQSASAESEGDLEQAEGFCREALSIVEQEGGPESPDAANVLHSLGWLLEQQGKHEEAADCARRAVDILEPLLPHIEGDEGKMLLLHSLGLLGTALQHLDAVAEADRYLTHAVELAEELPEHPQELIGTLNNLGVLCRTAGAYDRGERVLARALDTAHAAFGEQHLMIAFTLHNLAGLRQDRGDHQGAEEPGRRAWEIHREMLGDEHPDALGSAVAYAGVLAKLGRYAEARDIYERCLAADRRLFGPESGEVAAVLHNLAVNEQLDGKLDRALELYREAGAIKRRVLGDGNPETALTAMNMAVVLLQKGQNDDARRLASEAMQVFTRELPEEHPHLELCRDVLRQASLTLLADE